MQFFIKIVNHYKCILAAAIFLFTYTLHAQTVPITVNDTLRFCEGTAVTVNVLSNDMNDAGETLEVDILTGPFSPFINYNDGGLPEGTYNIFVDPGFAGQDVMFYEVCGDEDNLCAIGTIVIIVSGAENCVWPGDANQDSICNYLDLLPIGVYFGNNGPQRYDIDGTWEESYCDSWDEMMEYMIATNPKFADCNGDGIVDAQDTLIISTNYGQTHGTYEPTAYIGGLSDPVLGLEFFSDTIEAGSQIIIPLILGSFDIPASNVYGLAFELDYDETLIVPGSVNVTFNSGWLGIAGEDIISLQNNDTINGVISAAVTRINQISRSGSGHVGEVSFVMEDNIAGKLTSQISMPVNFCINFPTTLNKYGGAVFVNPKCDSIIVYQVTGTVENYYLNNTTIFPNPADDIVHIEVPENISGMYTVQNIFGQIMYQNTFDANALITFSCHHFPSGNYTVTIQNAKTVFTKKFIIQH